MSQSLSVVYIHLVFSTKERRPWLQDPQLRAALHAQLGEVSRRLECPPVRVGGVEDHVHLVARFGRTITQAEWVKELKRISSRWLKEQSGSLCDFEWQGGYADFSVSQSNLNQVRDYVANQEEHHHKRSFQDELRMLLIRHEVEWDERYVWD
jgi:REP element-mobilizing transposase RayT